jgi:hypothetical protein
MTRHTAAHRRTTQKLALIDAAACVALAGVILAVLHFAGVR